MVRVKVGIRDKRRDRGQTLLNSCSTWFLRLLIIISPRVSTRTYRGYDHDEGDAQRYTVGCKDVGVIVAIIVL